MDVSVVIDQNISERVDNLARLLSGRGRVEVTPTRPLCEEGKELSNGSPGLKNTISCFD
jgi:hypothetical protein